MTKRWLQRGVLLVILAVIAPFGCAHNPVAEQSQIRPDDAQGAKSTLGSQKDRCEAVARARERLPGLQEGNDVFVNENIPFGYDVYAISPVAAEILKAKASFLAVRPGLIVQVEGHCDERGTVEYNLALGERRAKAVEDYLCALGIASERIQTISYGEERPLDPGHNEEAWAKNRRASFLIMNP